MQNKIKKTLLLLLLLVFCFSLNGCKDNDDETGKDDPTPPVVTNDVIGLDISGVVNKYDVGIPHADSLH